MNLQPYERLMVNVLQSFIDTIEKIDYENLIMRCKRNPKTKNIIPTMLIKRCKGYCNLMTSKDWEKLTLTEQKTIAKHVTKDMQTLKDLIIE